MELFYFPPHQDDELTNLGPDLVRAVSSGANVHVILCTDGGASGVKKMLCRGDGCRWHEGAHHYTLSAAQFVSARDTEFTESCLALGVPPQNIRISPLRAPDSALTVQRATQIMREALAGYDPAQCSVRTIAPAPEMGQNPDHTAVGLAAKQLFAEGVCHDLRLFHEFILLPPSRAGFSVIEPDAAETEKIKKAAACYRCWAPGRGRYAVGYHSVADEFDAFLQRPICVIETH